MAKKMIRPPTDSDPDDNDGDDDDDDPIDDDDDLDWLNDLAGSLPCGGKLTTEQQNKQLSTRSANKLKQENRVLQGPPRFTDEEEKEAEQEADDEEKPPFLDNDDEEHSFQINPEQHSFKINTQLLFTDLGGGGGSDIDNTQPPKKNGPPKTSRNDEARKPASSLKKKTQKKKKKKNKKNKKATPSEQAPSSDSITTTNQPRPENNTTLGGEGFQLDQSGLLFPDDHDNRRPLYEQSILMKDFDHIDDGDGLLLLPDGMVKSEEEQEEGHSIINCERDGGDQPPILLEKGIMADLIQFVDDETTVKSLLRNDLRLAKQRVRNRVWRTERRGEYCCDICGRTLRDPETFKTHLDRQHPDGASGASSNRRNSLYRQPTPSNSFPMPKDCDQCLFSTIWRADFRRHARRHTYADRSWPCPTCPKSFFDRNSLKRHEGIVHDDRRPYTCDTCTKAFKSPAHLRRHHQDAHTDNKEETAEKKRLVDPEFDLKPGVLYVVCDTCLQWFVKREMPTHACMKGRVISDWRWKVLIRRSKYGPDASGRPAPKSLHPCPHCGKNLAKRTSRRKHVERFHENAVKCELCLASVPRDQLDVHMRKHESGHICSECGAAFVRSDGLNRHMADKHSTKTFVETLDSSLAMKPNKSESE